MSLLDHLSHGRAIFGSGPGALVSDAVMQGIDPMTQRDRQDEALGVILRLLRGETVTAETEWFRLKEALLQILPVQEEMEAAVANGLRPSGMKLVGKYGIGVLSIGADIRRARRSRPLVDHRADGCIRLPGPSPARQARRARCRHRRADRRDCRAPVGNTVGELGRGFQQQMASFDVERMLASYIAVGEMTTALERTREFLDRRVVVGNPLLESQHIQFPRSGRI